MKELLNKPMPAIPMEVQNKLDQPAITCTDLNNCDLILESDALQQEIGYSRFPDGSWMVSMVCPMPGITKEMIDWWFWWHCQENLRYQIWFPGDHISIKYHHKDRAYFEQSSVSPSVLPSMPPFQPNSQCPVERIGGTIMPLRIDFITPEQFGFTKDAMKRGNIATIVCGHVSAFNGLVPHTEMAHIYKQTDDGLFLISRFWLGKTMHPMLRKFVMTRDMARGMAEHCCVEYRNLVQILPGLYQKYGQ